VFGSLPGRWTVNRGILCVQVILALSGQRVAAELSNRPVPSRLNCVNELIANLDQRWLLSER
jgi:hypothetical protein